MVCLISVLKSVFPFPSPITGMPSFLFSLLFLSVLLPPSFAQENCNKFSTYNISCSDNNNNQSIININGTGYRLLTDTTNNPFILAPTTSISPNNCSSLPTQNTTLESSVLSYTDQTVTLTLYRCPPSSPSALYSPIGCSEDNPDDVSWFYLPPSYPNTNIPDMNCLTIILPVLKNATEGVLDEKWDWESFISAFEGGFEVNFISDNSYGGYDGFTIPLSVVVGFLIAVCFGLCFLCCKRGIGKYMENIYEDEPIIAHDSLLFEPKTIELATQNFSESNKIGQGGFGFVYKGIIPARKQEIAVKLLCSHSHQGIEELRNEVSLLAKLKHKNLVQLLGFCVGRQEKCLIYEYVNNQSLDKFLSDPVKKVQLVWQKRYNIIKGIAKGLLYLHEESHVKIIHRDLKASNVLLDLDLNPKIADFGLARIIDLDLTKDTTRRIAGTFGYMSPEYVTCGHFSTKSDVFSFGVLLLEIIMGRKSSDFYHDSNESTNLLSFVWENWQKRAISTIVDSSLGTNYAMDEALTCIQIGLLCVQESPNDRITMGTVVRLLHNYPISINAPSRPAFLLDGENKFNDLFSSGVGVKFDQNELSITELEFR